MNSPKFSQNSVPLRMALSWAALCSLLPAATATCAACSIITTSNSSCCKPVLMLKTSQTSLLHQSNTPDSVFGTLHLAFDEYSVGYRVEYHESWTRSCPLTEVVIMQHQKGKRHIHNNCLITCLLGLLQKSGLHYFESTTWSISDRRRHTFCGKGRSVHESILHV